MGWVYYASGSNAPGEIRGFSDIGQHVGVSALDCKAPCERALVEQLKANRKLRVFVDSGAFSEFQSKRAITDAQWRKRLALMQRVAEAGGRRVLVILPDKIADQAETLRRLERYRPQIKALRQTGAELAIVLQGGELGPRAFERKARQAAGLKRGQYVAAFPFKAAATKYADLIRYLRSGHVPRRIHLLGLGPKSKPVGDRPKATDVRDQLSQLAPGVGWSWDSVLIRSEVGRAGNGRKLTRAQDVVRSDVAIEAVTRSPDPLPDFQELLPEPRMWVCDLAAYQVFPKAGIKALETLREQATTPARKRKYAEAKRKVRAAGIELFREALSLTAKEAAAFYDDPDGFLRREDADGVELWDRDYRFMVGESWMSPYEALFGRWVTLQTVQLRKRRAVRQAFGVTGRTLPGFD